MNSSMHDVLARWDTEGGPGQPVPKEDRQDLREYLTTKLADSGVPFGEAYKIVSAFGWGEWADGWDKGYGGAKEFYKARFSLDGGS